MRVLILGGGSFVGPALLDAALRRGDEVAVLNRGRTATPPPGVTHHRGDRTEPGVLDAVAAAGPWDAVLDTWTGAPAAVAASAAALADAPWYGYVSTRSVYRWPIPPGSDESAPVVDADPDGTDDADYGAAKRGAELALLRALGPERVLAARAGLVLGPRENIGRLPWWLRRLAAGGDVLAPGPPDRPLQYVDARDLADWLVDCAHRGVAGAFNAVSRPGHATMGDLLQAARTVTGGAARLEWVDGDFLVEQGVAPWTELPIWLPLGGEAAGLHDGDVRRALAAGLTCRPVGETVADTWAWMRSSEPVSDPGRPVGLDPDRERELLASWRGRAG